jgi:hypothetical protein
LGELWKKKDFGVGVGKKNEREFLFWHEKKEFC